MANFSDASLVAQLHVPGLVAFKALCDGVIVGMVLWFVHEDRAYYHLAAYTDRGYDVGASFGLFWTSLEHFSASLRVVSLGGGAGIQGDRG